MVAWTADTDRRLLLALVAANKDVIKYDYTKIAAFYGETTKASVDHRFRVLKKEVEKMVEALENGTAPPAPPVTPRKAKSKPPKSTTSTPSKGTNATPGKASAEEGSRKRKATVKVEQMEHEDGDAVQDGDGGNGEQVNQEEQNVQNGMNGSVNENVNGNVSGGKRLKRRVNVEEGSGDENEERGIDSGDDDDGCGSGKKRKMVWNHEVRADGWI